MDKTKRTFLIDLAAIDMSKEVIVGNDPDKCLNYLLYHTDMLTTS